MAQTAIVGEKVGMTQKWVDDRMLAVTVLRVEPMRVVQIKTCLLYTSPSPRDRG